ncbi:MAG: tetraacyldisaccharide 4'-kinase [Vicinamibacteraceae bacterium]
MTPGPTAAPADRLADAAPVTAPDPGSRALYARVAAWRRRRYARSGRARRLARPVISVGNVASGGRAKTPIVACLARLLVEAGERPAILSRGYGRTDPADGVTVVSDGVRALADLARAGDEPSMLARGVPGAGVFVCPDRFWAGTLAERRFGATVHLLDDGFQHLTLARDVDLAVVSAADEHDRPLPRGGLREAFGAIRHADAIIVTGESPASAAALAARWGVAHAFTAVPRPSVPRAVDPWGGAVRLPRDRPVIAVAGIARPDAFFTDLEASGWHLVDRLAFRDHHAFTATDVATIVRRIRATGAEAVLTTEKDAVRLLPLRPLPFAAAFVPLTVTIEPQDVFARWLFDRLAAER